MKKLLFFVALLSQVTLFADFLANFIGKDKAYLEANGFKCGDFSCVSKDQNFFNVKTLDDAIEYVETYRNDQDEVYKIAIYLLQNDKLKNKELDEAFFKAVTKLNEKSKLAIEITRINDKFGAESVVTMTDAKKASAYVNAMRDTYIESMKQYNDKK